MTKTPSHPEIRALAARAAALAIAILAPFAVGMGRLRPADAAGALVISLLAVLLGRYLGTILRLPERPGFTVPFEIVAGFCALGILQLAVAHFFHFASIPALAFSGVIVLALFLLRRRTAPPADAGPPDLAVLLAISALATLWSREALGALREAGRSGIFDAWEDFFLHATQIGWLRHYPAFAGQSLHLSGTPELFYHRGSYAIPAAFAAMAGITNLEAATCFWLPTGLILMGAGIYCLGSALGGRVAGLAAVLALFLLPDPSNYGLRNGYLAFEWLLEVAPACGYAVGIVAIGLAAATMGLAASRPGLVASGAVMASASILLKVQIAAPAALTFATLLALSWRPARRWHAAAAGAAVLAAGAAVVLLMEHILLAPHLLTGPREFSTFLDFSLAQAPPPFGGLRAGWTAHHGTIVKSVSGVALLLAAAFGAVLPAAVLAAWARRSRTPWRVAMVPFVLLASFLACMFLLPTPAHGSFADMIHPAFLPVYAVLVAWTVAGAALLLGSHPGPGWRSRPATAAACAALVAAGLAAAWGHSARLQQSTLPWGLVTGVVPLPGGLLETARHVRETGTPGDRLLSSDADPLGIVAGLTERPAFLSREANFRRLGGRLAAIAASRRVLLSDLGDIRTRGQLVRFGLGNGVRWFLLRPGDMPAWPPSLLRGSDFESGGFRVYDLAAPPAR